jgi:very-short-patch-repair endonuclease
VITGPRDVVKRARKLRSEMSLPEGLLWRELRKRPGGFRFRGQYRAGDNVLDFYCAAVRLAIEADGFAHESSRAAHADSRRSEWLRSQHIATTRIPARAVPEDVAAGVSRLVEICGLRVQTMSEKQPVPLNHPADGPPPRAGEEL